MARTNNLTNFLNDVATAIKAKLGDNTPIPASQFDTKIGEIETVGTYQSKTINVTANGSQTITPDTDYDALSSVLINVQVPIPSLQTKNYEFTQNTHIVLSPETGYDGFSSIDLTINVPTIDTSDATATVNDIVKNKTAYVNGEKIEGAIIDVGSGAGFMMDSIYENTTHKTLQFSGLISSVYDNDIKINQSGSLDVVVYQSDLAEFVGLTAEKIVSGNTILGIEGIGSSIINNQDKTIIQNGTYTADSGYTGLGTVTVNVPSGSGDVKLFETEQAMQADPDASEGDLAVVYREELTGVTEESEFDSCTFPNTVVLDSAFSGNIYSLFRAVDQSVRFNGGVEMSSSRFIFSGYGGSGDINVQYTSSDGITYTRTDGGDELQEFGTIIKWESGHREFNDVIGNFMKIGGMVFEGLYEYKTNQYVIADSQLTLSSSNQLLPGITGYGKNGVEVGTLTTSVSNSFTDVNAEVYAKIQAQYNNMQPRILTNQDRDIDSDIRIIPSKTDGTPLLDTSNVTNMVDMFTHCKSLTTISLLNTSNVTDMGSMFYDCSSLTTIPLLNTSNVTRMDSMFAYCKSLTTIPLLNTSNVTRMDDMFSSCSNLTTIPLLNTSNVTRMDAMFSDCTNLTSIPLLDTSNVTYMIGMFNRCSSLNNESLNNILAMCTNAAKITSNNKTLKYIGLTEEQANICKTLSNYSAFIAAGWTTGY